MPIDMFGPARAGFGVAALTFSYGLMQTFLSPAIGSVVDHVGFTAVCFSMAALPLIGVGILQFVTAMSFRPATQDDLPAIASIQGRRGWPAADYLSYECTVAEVDGKVAAFVAARQIAPGEREILYLAVDAAQRRRGIARALIQHALASFRGAWFLEVREANAAAQRSTKALVFVRSDAARSTTAIPRRRLLS